MKRRLLTTICVVTGAKGLVFPLVTRRYPRRAQARQVVSNSRARDAASAGDRSMGLAQRRVRPRKEPQDDDALREQLTHEFLPDETLYILDGTSMMFRAFYGVAGESYLASDGATEVGAVRTMGTRLAQFVTDVQPRYLAVAFDVSRESTFRRAMYPAYKAQRPEHPTALTLQMPLAKALVPALGCRCFELEGYEADDVMATLARWGRSVGLNVAVVSDDKDMCQLAADRVHIMAPRTSPVPSSSSTATSTTQFAATQYAYLVRDAADIAAAFGGLAPSMLPEIIALAGDAADNIPGVKGIGFKGATALLKEFGSLEKIFAAEPSEIAALQIRGAAGLQKKLAAPGAREAALLYREVAMLQDEVPLPGLRELKSNDLRFRGATREAAGVLKALGFRGPLEVMRVGVRDGRIDASRW